MYNQVIQNYQKIKLIAFLTSKKRLLLCYKGIDECYMPWRLSVYSLHCLNTV